ncbi:MAG: hypothetical protein KAJ03_02630 [Gammaproteobacteria bacterium]|nr:hypothetical protein [Gammaproteobacteria bacterium]
MTTLADRDEANADAAQAIKERVGSDAVGMCCSNPACSAVINVTAKQKRDFLVSYRKRYGKTVYPCCSHECRDIVLNMMM